jgi:hypothetical protein
MALLTGSNVLGTSFTPSVGSFLVQATGGVAVLERRQTSGSAWARMQPPLNGNSNNGASFKIDNPVAGVEYRFVALDGSTPTVRADQSTGSITTSGSTAVGTTGHLFFDNFHDFDTVNNWELVQSGSGMTISGPLGGAVAGSTPYLNIASGTTVGKTVLLSRAIFTTPVDVRFQISASQRIANNRLIVALVQCDEDGVLITDSTYATADIVLNARNAVGQMHDGTTATTGQLLVRASGSAIDQLANAFGTGFTTVATGTTPNFISATTYGFSVERDKINSRAYGQNLITNTGGQFGYDRTIPNPSALYRLAVIVENNDVPASSTDWRIHLINVLDASALDVSPRNAGNTDASKGFPVLLNGGIVSSVSTVTSITTAGTPTAPATPYILNSLATTNGALILTGTSGLHAFFATNTGATPAFVKLYNKATAPIVGTDVPAMIIPVPAAVSGVPGVATLPIGTNGFRFALGLGIAITGGVADGDTQAVGAGQVKVILSRTV